MRTFTRQLLFCLSLLMAVSTVFTLLPPSEASALSTKPKRVATSDQSKVIVKFKAGADIDLRGSGFARGMSRGAAQQDARLNNLLNSNGVTAKRRLISEPKATIQERRWQAPAPQAGSAPDLENYYELNVGKGRKADDVAAQLRKLDTVVTAYAKPIFYTATLAPDYTPIQNYLKPAPTGLSVNPLIGNDASLNKTYPGAKGGNVKIVDLEFGWDTWHEDLSMLREAGAYWKNGIPASAGNTTDHGTATAGVIAGVDNGRGITGIAPKANFHIANVYNEAHGFVISDSIYKSANKMTAGDVMLIELQAPGPDGESWAPIEIYPDVYDAIKYATSRGIIVIEPAGNGRMDRWEGVNLDAAMFDGAFTTKPNSGAIMVGAGGSGCDSSAPARARNTFSNYGSRVDVQGVGDCVVTTGYGDLFFANINASYTSTYNGTSSASATIAGIAGSLSSAYTYINKKPMPLSAVKAALLYGAQPQDTSVNPGKVGPRPNMAHALKKTDITKPKISTTLYGKRLARNKISLTWKAASDNLPYVRYNIYRNGAFLKQVSSTKYTDTSLKTKGTYTYKVIAADASGNASSATKSIKVVNK